MKANIVREHDVTGCSQCIHYQRTVLFELCGHTAAKYNGDNQHSIQHMRDLHVGACGEKGRLFAKKP